MNIEQTTLAFILTTIQLCANILNLINVILSMVNNYKLKANENNQRLHDVEYQDDRIQSSNIKN